MLYEHIFQALNNQKVKYLVVGGVAVYLHGIPRFTKDLDLLVDMSPANLKRMIQAFEKIGYIPRIPVNALDFADPKKREEWIKEKNMKAFTFIQTKPPFEQVDIVFAGGISYQEAVKKKKKIVSKEVPLWVISIEDLIRMKSKAGRTQDQADIVSLKKVKRIQ